MRSLYLNFISISCLFVASQLSSAEDTPVEMLPPMTIIQARQSLDEYASQNSDIYNAKKLEAAHERLIDDVLSGEKGISITKPGTQGTGRIYLRGVGGRGLITLDGIPIAEALPNAMNLAILIPDSLGEMEVTRGFSPASRAFSALGGAIRLTSREATNNSGDVRVEGGTYGFLKETLRTNFASDHARLAVTANRSDAFDGSYQADVKNGNPERDPFHSTQVMFRGDVDITEDILWNGTMSYHKSNHSADAGGLKNGILQHVDDKKSFLLDEGWFAQNTLKAKINETWISRLQLGFTKNDVDVAQTALSPAIKSDFYMARWENDGQIWRDNNNSFNMIWGAEERYETASAPLANREIPPKLTGVTISQHRHQEAGFLDNRFTYGLFSGDVGVRYESYEQYGNHALLHLGTAWQLSKTLKLTTNAGNGFRMPSYQELLFPVVGNLNLKPESNIGGDLGFEWQALSNLKLNATGFYSRYSDMIVLAYNTKPPCGNVCLTSIDDSIVAGMETGGEIRFNSQWRGGFAYTFTDTENLANHKAIPFRPSHVSRIWGEWKSVDLPLTLWSEGIYQNQAQQNIVNNLPVDANFRINIHANYQVSPELDLYVRGENLTNNTSQMMFSYNQTGAMVFGGIALKLW